MNQLIETFGVNWKLLIMQGVNFSILLVALWYFLYRPLMQMLEERRKKIESGVVAAEAAQAEREKAGDERRDILTKAAEESEQIVANAREVATGKADGIVAGAHERAEGLMTDAAARAEELSAKAMRESEREIARAATLAAEKILREKAH